jgi:hypothetical protein
MLVRASGSMGFRNSMSARLLGVTCQAALSPTATFSMRSSGPKAIMDWKPRRPCSFTTAPGS